jgi:hypothetical protein
MAAFFKLSSGKDIFSPYEYLIAETRVIRLLNDHSILLKRVYETKRGAEYFSLLFNEAVGDSALL